MTKLILFLLCVVAGMTSAGQRIERSLVGCTGETYTANGFQLSFSIGEPVVIPSPSATFDVPTFRSMASIGFQQPHIAATGAQLSTSNFISAYPSPTTGRVRLDIHGDNFQANAVRIYNSMGKEVAVKPFLLTNGSIDIFLDGLPAGIYMVCVTDKNVGNTIATRIVKQNK